MIRRFRLRYRSFLGIDISPPYVNLLVLAKKGPVIHLEHFASQSFGVDEDPYSNPKELVSCIKNLMQSVRIQDAQAIIAIPDSSVFSKTYQCLKSLTSREIKEWLAIEAQKKLGSKDITIDFVILGENKTNPNLLDVLLVASHCNNIEKRLEIMRQAGVDVRIVESESFAIKRAIIQIIKQEFSHLETHAPIAVVVIGQDFKLFVFEQENMIWFSEETCFKKSESGSSFGELLQKNLQFFFASTCHSTLHHIYLAGNVENITNLASQFALKTSMATSVANPFKCFQVNTQTAQKKDAQCSSFLLATGMALRMQ